MLHLEQHVERSIPPKSEEAVVGDDDGPFKKGGGKDVTLVFIYFAMIIRTNKK